MFVLHTVDSRSIIFLPIFVLPSKFAPPPHPIETECAPALPTPVPPQCGRGGPQGRRGQRPRRAVVVVVPLLHLEALPKLLGLIHVAQQWVYCSKCFEVAHSRLNIVTLSHDRDSPSSISRMTHFLTLEKTPLVHFHREERETTE